MSSPNEFEQVEAQILPPALQNAADEEVHGGLIEGSLSKHEVLRRLTDKLPTNELGLPTYIYRTDLIPQDILDPSTPSQERAGILDMASMSLDYWEGYPTQPNGTAFWSKLEFEPTSAYHAFMHYLGVGKISADNGNASVPVRTFQTVEEATGLSTHELRELAHLYYWGARCKAYDLFTIASYHKQREHRAILVEDAQFKSSTVWLEKVEKRLKEIFEDPDELLDLRPKEVFDMMEKLWKHQRISAGMPSNGTSAKDGEEPKNASLAVTLRSIAAGAGETAQDGESSNDDSSRILENPENLGKLQELIIEMSGNQ